VTLFAGHPAQGDKEREFPGLASKLRSTISPSLTSKPVATVLVVWPQIPLAQVSRFGPQNR
jgi:hypothetical protein